MDGGLNRAGAVLLILNVKFSPPTKFVGTLKVKTPGATTIVEEFATSTGVAEKFPLGSDSCRKKVFPAAKPEAGANTKLTG